MGIKIGDTVKIDGYSMKDNGCIGEVVDIQGENCKVKTSTGENWYHVSQLILLEGVQND